MEWIDIKGYEGLYQVNSLGEIKSLKRNTTSTKILKQKTNKFGYKTVNLSNNGVAKSKTVHRLVAETLLVNVYGKPCVNHKDCDKSNNKLENLEWVTYKENMAHAYKNKLVHINSGIKNGMSKLLEREVVAIRRLGIVRSSKELALAYGVSESHINAIKRGSKRKNG